MTTVQLRVTHRYTPKDGEGPSFVGIVRKRSPCGVYFRIDDGDPKNDDLLTNGYENSAWAHPSELRVMRYPR